MGTRTLGPESFSKVSSNFILWFGLSDFLPLGFVICSLAVGSWDLL